MGHIELDTALAQIEDLMAKKQYAAVIDFCEKVEGQLSDSYEVFYHRAQAKNVLSDVEGALRDLSVAIDLEPREPALFFFRGLWSIDVGDYASANRDIQKAIELEDKLGSSYYRQSAKFVRAVALLF